MSTLLRRRRGQGRGQSLVEFALILPVFLLLIFGIIDLGRAVYAYSTLNSAAREAARVAVVDQTAANITDEAVKQAFALDIEDADVTLDWRTAFNLDVPNSCAAFIGTIDAVSCTLILTIDYEFVAATPIIGNVVGPIDMAGESQMIVEFNCVEPPPAPLASCQPEG